MKFLFDKQDTTRDEVEVVEPMAGHDIEQHDNGVQYRSDIEVRFDKVDCSLCEQNSLLYCCQEGILKCYC